MKSVLRTIAVSLVVAVTVAGGLQAQNVKIPAGSYVLQPDSNAALAIDVSTITVDFTDSTMTALQNGAMVVRSKIVMAGDQMTLTDVDGQAACGSPAKYKVTLLPKGLRMTPIEDACDQRSVVLASVTLARIN